MLSLRRLFIALIIFFVITGGIFAFISTLLFYTGSEREMTQEKVREVHAVAQLLFTKDTAAPYYPHTVPPETIARILAIARTERGTNFFRILSPDTQRIILSSDQEEIGAAVTDLPSAGAESVRVSAATHNTVPTISLAYQDQSGEILWLSIEQVFFAGPTILLAIQQSFLFIALITLITIALYLIGNNFIIRPLKEVQVSLLTFGKGDLDTRLPPGPPNEFGRVFNAFNDMADKLQEARARDEHVSEMKSVFISTAAHQLRTPLSGIKWALASLTSGEFGALSKEQQTLLVDMEGKSTEVIDIVNTLLNVASIEEGKFGFLLADTDLELILRSVVGDAERDRSTPHAPITLSIRGTIPHIHADAARMKWTLVNIIENALNYTPADGTITVTLSSSQKSVKVTVADTGIGIPAQERKKIYQKFSRGSNAVRMHSNGNGLGLFIAKNIVEYHKGTLSFTSKENVGTTFTITLPQFNEPT